MSTQTEEISPSETIYIKNLQEKIKIPVLKDTLRKEFEPYGKVLDVVAHGNLRLRGQAFVVFDDVESAIKAREGQDKHEIFGKPMVIQFAKTKSDAAVSKLGQEALERHKTKRLSAKELRQVNIEKTQKRQAAEPKVKKPTKKAKESDSDLFLPPNKMLLLQNLPEGLPVQELEAIYDKYEGFVEVRYVAIRRLAFVEYLTEENAIVAKEGTFGLVLNGSSVKVTYAKK